jgi:hypothetical protein
MDPLSVMLMASGQQQPGMENMLNPAGSMPMGGAPMANPMAPAGGAQGGGGLGSIGDMLSGIKAPQAEAPKFSGGVSGSGLPYVSRMEDLVNPFLQATGANRPPSMPTLGALLSQAPGGGR